MVLPNAVHMNKLFRASYRLAAIKAVLNAGTVFSAQKRIFHSKPQDFQHTDMKIRLLPALQDNYMYLLIDEDTKECAVVDPVEPDKVLSAVQEEGVKLTSVLTTHHHWDHAGGNKELLKKSPGLAVYGGDKRIDELNNEVNHGNEFKIGSLNVKCLFTPCHTKGHICYFVTGQSNEQPAVFTGDTLFVGGCGRFFEGNEDHMYKALVEILATLPKQTNQRQNNLPTIPSTIEEELTFNPFMRVG
ncbi:hypothetical protein KUTeg_008395 [Tegillarca granosa]|uniref:hydroxyacylglutathione hydrolase n=1 Tax=Tegillarca granosa TaxID=220873 RepID=A0ABQ9F910_TEGGR|nr:hypothetical protein KUTeg_008395 [Tegillarca granosa]